MAANPPPPNPPPKTPTIPWAGPKLWQEASAAITHLIHQAGGDMQEARFLAETMARRLQSIFPALDRLCQLTCPHCPDPCCRRAWIWFDYRDLLFLHLARLPIPPAQLISRKGARCRYIAPGGCRLDRLRRPFICTWYLCPVQVRRLEGRARAGKAALDDALLSIKFLRRKLETAFMRATI